MYPVLIPWQVAIPATPALPTRQTNMVHSATRVILVRLINWGVVAASAIPVTLALPISVMTMAVSVTRAILVLQIREIKAVASAILVTPVPRIRVKQAIRLQAVLLTVASSPVHV